ncbi:MAG: 3-keto-5-aminohexanoate cleavage protein [Hoeflea sp.]|uniref:3-keto-5-aminohexanoate cleavage protein n=1 Tax=Hoeflea sp. TaxID=1940281 RepID=UPI002730179E|nr:3-keto-5-aminohexanoate cleavage protein [Hoeflea sp.]MDP2122071.1 3-keto-5-aminohexanoate cleavage protein [Hoeflea sp.]
MIVQACLNGARPAEFHPQLPLTPEAMAADAIGCVTAGAAELHIHPRGEDQRESLAAVDATVAAVRTACPGTLIGVSTGAWIENDVQETRYCIAAWSVLPDYASVNLSEPDAPEVMALLRSIGVGIEAGIATVADAERFVGLADHEKVLRILIEIEDQEWTAAFAIADGIASVLAGAGVTRSILLHGFDATVWDFVKLARTRNWSTRIGLEDCRHMPDGRMAAGNAALVGEAVAMYRRG